jgi:hypothetical protein
MTRSRKPADPAASLVSSAAATDDCADQSVAASGQGLEAMRPGDVPKQWRLLWEFKALMEVWLYERS